MRLGTDRVGWNFVRDIPWKRLQRETRCTSFVFPLYTRHSPSFPSLPSFLELVTQVIVPGKDWIVIQVQSLERLVWMSRVTVHRLQLVPDQRLVSSIIFKCFHSRIAFIWGNIISLSSGYSEAQVKYKGLGTSQATTGTLGYVDISV